MFKIDLLNGVGLPPRSHPLTIAAGTVAFVIIAVVAAFDAVHAYGLTRQIAGQQRAIATYDRQIAELGDVAKTLEAADKRTSRSKPA